MNIKKIQRKVNLLFSNLSTNFSFFFGRVSLKITLGNNKERYLIGILPIVGYAIVAMSFVDFVSVLFPLQLQNPDWELKTISTFVEQIWAFLIGLGFIFARYFKENQGDIRSVEIFFLRFIRWFMLIMAIALLLMIPLVLLDTNRLLSFFNGQISTQKNNALKQVSQLETSLAQGDNPDQVRSFAKALNFPPEVLNLPAPELQNIIKTNIADAKTKITQEAAQTQKQQSISTWKSSIKSIVGIIITSFTFIVIWLKIGKAFK